MFVSPTLREHNLLSGFYGTSGIELVRSGHSGSLRTLGADKSAIAKKPDSITG